MVTGLGALARLYLHPSDDTPTPSAKRVVPHRFVCACGVTWHHPVAVGPGDHTPRRACLSCGTYIDGRVIDGHS